MLAKYIDSWSWSMFILGSYSEFSHLYSCPNFKKSQYKPQIRGKWYTFQQFFFYWLERPKVWQKRQEKSCRVLWYIPLLTCLPTFDWPGLPSSKPKSGLNSVPAHSTPQGKITTTKPNQDSPAFKNGMVCHQLSWVPSGSRKIILGVASITFSPRGSNRRTREGKKKIQTNNQYCSKPLHLRNSLILSL